MLLKVLPTTNEIVVSCKAHLCLMSYVTSKTSKKLGTTSNVCFVSMFVLRPVLAVAPTSCTYLHDDHVHWWFLQMMERTQCPKWLLLVTWVRMTGLFMCAVLHFVCTDTSLATSIFASTGNRAILFVCNHVTTLSNVISLPHSSMHVVAELTQMFFAEHQHSRKFKTSTDFKSEHRKHAN